MAQRALAKTNADREADKKKIMTRADCRWALDACNWHRVRKGCSKNCQCNWCKTARVFEAMLENGGDSMIFSVEDREKKNG